MQKDPFLSIIIPTYNEEANIGKTLDEISIYLKSKDFSTEMIVVDDGSVDNTVKIAKEHTDRFNDLRIIESKPNKGKGHVIRTAMMQSKGEFSLFMDADGATSIKELDNFLSYMDESCDVIIGSRRLKESVVEVSEPPLRIFLGQIYILLSRLLLGIRVRDINCGFKVFKREAAKEVFSVHRMDGWTIDSEALFIARRKGFSIKEVPVKWTHQVATKVRPFKAGIDSLLGLINIRLNAFKGLYK